jgi:D-3-phosphoglycerate dehydrogenase / 2-oxoglutarate reductase
MTYPIVLETVLHKSALDLLATRCEVSRCPAGPEGVAVARRVAAQAAIVGSTWRIGGEVLDQLPGLRVIGRPGIGVDNIDLEAAAARGVAVVNTPDGPTVSTAEHTVALLLALAKRLRSAPRMLGSGGSPYDGPPHVELEGKILGLVGLGRVGRRVARIGGPGLGMRVIAFDPYVGAEGATALGVELCSSIADVLRSADFVSLHLPSTPQTRRLIDADALALMKPTAYLINCARGPILDEVALLAALRAGTLAGAALDVFDPEPPSPAHPLFAMENVVATPHAAGFTEDALRKMGLGVVEGILAVLAGDRPANLVTGQGWTPPASPARPLDGAVG